VRWRVWLVLLTVAFCLTVLTRLPLSWLSPLLPANVRCEQPTGSLWQGGCGAVRLTTATGANSPLSDATVAWRWLPLRLLRLRLALSVQLQVAGTTAEALLQRGWGRWEVLELNARGPLDHRLLPLAPVGWSGRLQIDHGRLRWQDGQLTALDGVVMASELRSAPPQSLPYGSYRLQLAPAAQGAPIIGQLVDVDGPLGVSAQWQISPTLAWQLEGTVITRATAAETLALQLQMLGNADAQGRRQFSMAGQL
jgi:hypothetical protein